jgi:hypothetical protein
MAKFQFSDGQSEVHGDFSKLEDLIKNLKENHFTDVGVFETAKTADGKQVAEYGAYNEFGSVSVANRPPKRSFIRMPLEVKQDDIRKYAEKHSQEHLEKGDVKAIFEDIGIACEAKIQEAFDTRGFGSWVPNAESTIKQKGSDAPLITNADTLLRKVITHRTK